MYHTPEPPGVPGAFHRIPPASLGNIYLIRGLWSVIPWGPWPETKQKPADIYIIVPADIHACHALGTFM